MRMLSLLAVLHRVIASAIELGAYNATLSKSDTTCVCTTVSCPVAGNNVLNEGGSTVITYRYTMHGNRPVVTSAEGTVRKFVGARHGYDVVHAVLQSYDG